MQTKLERLESDNARLRRNLAHVKSENEGRRPAARNQAAAMDTERAALTDRDRLARVRSMLLNPCSRNP